MVFWFVANGVFFGTLLCVALCRLFALVNRKSSSIAFLHPYCAGGGGGERVLWDAISYMLEHRNRKLNFSQLVIYSADTKKQSLASVLKKVESRFDIRIPAKQRQFLSLVPLRSYFVIEPKYHKVATLLLQSLSATILALEGLFKFTPRAFIDTTGMAMTCLDRTSHMSPLQATPSRIPWRACCSVARS